jgi:hypothetical protein
MSFPKVRSRGLRKSSSGRKVREAGFSRGRLHRAKESIVRQGASAERRRDINSEARRHCSRGVDFEAEVLEALAPIVVGSPHSGERETAADFERRLCEGVARDGQQADQRDD